MPDKAIHLPFQQLSLQQNDMKTDNKVDFNALFKQKKNTEKVAEQNVKKKKTGGGTKQRTTARPTSKINKPSFK
jgi:hypothetical protein